MLAAAASPAAWPAARRAQLRFGVPLALAAVVAVYLFALWPWMLSWGTTPYERERSLPGDELVVGATDQSTRAVTVHAPASVTWQWLVQLGENRAGFYSYSWLENLFGANVHNGDRLRPEWQHMRVGDLVRAVPEGYLGMKLETPGWRVVSMDPGRWFVLQNWGVFFVEPVDANTSRLIVRTRFRDETWWGPIVTVLAFDPVHFVMERRMLLGIAQRAEGRRTPLATQWLAGAGFALASVATAWGLARGRRRRWLLVLPAGLAIAVLSATGDVVAAMAGFTALGATVLGLTVLRRWWPVLLPVPAVVLLVLLLSSDAFVVFGVAFLTLGVAWRLLFGAPPAAQLALATAP